MSLPENIDALLVKYDITQEQLARVADVAPSSVARWRRGAQMRKVYIQRICDYFGLSEDDLLSTDAGLAAKEHGRIPAANLSPDESELLALYRSANAQGKASILAVARASSGMDGRLAHTLSA